MTEQHRVVLLVDDEEFIHKALTRSLRGDAYELIHAYDAAQAASMLEIRDDIAAVICDHCMPGVAGLDFLVDVRRRYPHVKTMLLTALADVEEVTRSVNRGDIHCYMTKPWKRSVLQEELWGLVYGLPDLDAEAA